MIYIRIPQRLTTAEWNGLVKSAAIYDQLKQRNSSTADRFCAQARSECSAGK